MIYIATIHHETDKFIDLQQKYYAKYTEVPYKIYCGLSHANNQHYFDAQKEGKYPHFHFVDLNEVENQHWFRLNYLAKEILKVEKRLHNDDIIVFTDGDAFVVAPWAVPVTDILNAEDNLVCVAISRDENPEPFLAEEFKPYPHPCFAASNLRFWENNNLQWSLEPPHIVTAGPTLKRWYKENNYIWMSVTRTNIYNVHPLYFGVYGDFLYHHGAGNRAVYDSIDIWPRKGLQPSFNLDLRFPHIPAFNKKLSDLVLGEILDNDDFINHYLLGRGSEPIWPNKELPE